VAPAGECGGHVTKTPMRQTFQGRSTSAGGTRPGPFRPGCLRVPAVYGSVRACVFQWRADV